MSSRTVWAPNSPQKYIRTKSNVPINLSRRKSFASWMEYLWIICSLHSLTTPMLCNWVLIEIVSSHEWHLNFSPKLHQWRLSNGLEAIAEGHLRVWTDAIWGEKFKCHECTEQFLINTIKYWQNPFHLEEGKSQISQVWKKKQVNLIEGKSQTTRVLKK